jgi:AP2 domain
MDDIEPLKSLVRHWPITVERYPSGRIGFIARPGGQHKRVNKSFSTFNYPSNEEAARAAIEFCKQFKRGEYEKAARFAEAHPIPEEIRAHLSVLVKHALDSRLDPVQALKSGMRMQMRNRWRQTPQ